MAANLKRIFFFVVMFVGHEGACWQYFTDLSGLVTAYSKKHKTYKHTEYTFGNCAQDKVEYQTVVHLNHMDVLGKVIVRGWIKVNSMPVCIRLIGMDYAERSFRSTSFPFQMCVPRLSICHSQNRWLYYYYEWMIPADFEGGMDWNIYFFGAKTRWY